MAVKKTKKQKQNTEKCIPLIVGIGASAGGLEAFQKFFKKLPPTPDMTFVLVQHLDPNHETIMPDLLARVTDMPVEQVKDRTVLKKNRVYFIPPNATLTLEKSVLRVHKPKESHGHRTPIDLFFHSLAQSQGENSVAIILSGTGSDGSIGIKAVKEAGGMTVAQSSESAKYDSMPRTAVATGLVDYSLAVEEIPELLMNFAEHRDKFIDKKEPDELYYEAESQLNKIFKLLQKNFNHDFSEYKKATLIRRIQRRMKMCRVTSGKEYVAQLAREKGEVEQLFKDFLIGVTYFFRDKEAYSVLEEEVIPKIFSNPDNKELIRVWIVGCATGEEAYSIAILLHEARERANISPKIQIFATDIDKIAIDSARQGKYSEAIVKHISEKRLKNFFNANGNYYEVIKSIREMCLFSVHDLIRDPPFANLNLLSCRNVMIYMSAELQSKLIPLFNYSLKLDGYLLLGPAESIGPNQELFQIVNKKQRVFKSRVSLKRSPIDFPLSRRSERVVDLVSLGKKQSITRVQQFSEFLDRYMCMNYTEAHVVINENLDIQYFSEGLKTILSPMRGVPQSNVIQMADRNIRVELRSILHSVVKDRKKIISSSLLVKNNGHSEHIKIIADPLPKSPYGENLILVVFRKMPALPSKEQKTIQGEVGKLSESDAIQSLENELKETKTHLQVTVEELENTNEELKFSNEELLSMNEEMQSSNEELQTSQEEMQSINEELETVNSELNAKVEETDRANSDLINLFKSTQIATLFLDNDLRIKRFTPEAKTLFRMIESDIDRQLTDIAPNFSGVNLEEELIKVIGNLSTSEKIVQMERTGEWYKIRIHPYRTVKNVIEGAVITFYDITELKRFENELSDRLHQQTAVAELGIFAIKEDTKLNSLFDKTVELVASTLKADFCKVLKLSSDENSLKLVSGIGWKPGLVGKATVSIDKDSQAGYTLKSDTPVIVKDLSKEPRFSGPSLLIDHGVVSGMSLIIQGANNKKYGVLGVHTKNVRNFSDRDIQFIQSIANILSTAIERRHLNSYKNRLTQIVQSSQDIILSHKLNGEILHWNPAAEKIYGYSRDEAIGANIFELIIPKSKKDELLNKYHELKSGKSVTPFETYRIKKNGEQIPVLLSLSPICEDERVVAVSAIGRDISAQKEFEAALIKSKEDIQSASDLKSRFLGVLSHELRTPLSSVYGYTDLCLQLKSLTGEATDYLGKIKSNSLIIQRLIDDLMDISRIEGGSVEIKKKWFDMQEVLSEVFSEIWTKAKEKGLSFHVKWNQKVLDFIFTDPIRLKQIISNLGINSVKYTNSGNIDITCSFKYTYENFGVLEVEIIDSGIGIDSKDQKSLFEPFFRAAPNMGAQGVGLGLYLTKQLTSLLGGNIQLMWSEPGKGSSFRVQIPVKLKKNTNGKDTNKESMIVLSTSLKDISILIADDVEDLRLLFMSFLKSSGANVDLAEDGKEALDKGIKNSYDVIILDMVMPILNGTEVMKKLKSKGIKAPIIALTAHATENDRIKCLEAGFDGFQPKPVKKDDLVKKVLNILVSTTNNS